MTLFRSRKRDLARLRREMSWFDKVESDAGRANTPRWRKRWCRVVVVLQRILESLVAWLAGCAVGVAWVVAGLGFLLWRNAVQLYESWTSSERQQ